MSHANCKSYHPPEAKDITVWIFLIPLLLSYKCVLLPLTGLKPKHTAWFGTCLLYRFPLSACYTVVHYAIQNTGKLCPNIISYALPIGQFKVLRGDTLHTFEMLLVWQFGKAIRVHQAVKIYSIEKAPCSELCQIGSPKIHKISQLNVHAASHELFYSTILWVNIANFTTLENKTL